jgi:hypothetical protein
MNEFSDKDYEQYKLLSDQEENNLFNKEYKSNYKLDKELIRFKYFSILEPRKKEFLTFDVAFKLATGIGILKVLSESFNIRIDNK